MPLDGTDVAKLQEQMRAVWEIRTQIQVQVMQATSKLQVLEENLIAISAKNNDLLKAIVNINNAIKD